MRIIGTIPHPLLKITVFQMDQRISVKFENAAFEQTFKLGIDERYRSMEAVRKWVDETLVAEVLARMDDMYRSRREADRRAFGEREASEEDFEEII